MNTQRTRLMAVVFALCLIASAFQPLIASGLRSSLNSTKIGLGDTFELTLSVDSARATAGPDLAPLQKDFQILGTGQKSQINIINGRRTESFSWVITLAPNEQGTLTIPVITAGSATSEPITIEVVDAGQLPVGSSAAGELSIEVTADPGAHYVQEEIPVTVRIQSEGGIREASLEEPHGSDFVLTQTGEDQVSHSTRNGRDVSIIERHYFLKPQKSGSLTIPPMTLQATVTDPVAARSSIFSNFGFGNGMLNMPSGSSLFANMLSPGREVMVRSQPLNLEVKPRPTGDTVWFLPAKRVELHSDWAPANPSFRVGEAVTRKISLFALGAAEEQLPDIPIGNTDGARQYVDRSDSKSADTPEGTAAIREFDVSVVPTQPGEITLPAVDVRWWDTVTDQERVATLPAQTIRVAAGTGLNSPDTPATAAIPTADTLPTRSTDSSPEQSPGIWTRQAVEKTGLFSLAIILLMAGIVFILKRRGNRGRTIPTATANKPEGSPGSKKNFVVGLDQHERALVQACKANDLRSAYSALSAWIWLERNTAGTVSPGLTAELATMEKQLFARTSDTTWHGQHVLEVFNREKTSGHRSARGNSGRKTIPALYPA